MNRDCQVMSNTESQSNQPFGPPASEPDPESPEILLDEPNAQTSSVGTPAEEVGSPVEDEGTATDLDEL